MDRSCVWLNCYADDAPLYLEAIDGFPFTEVYPDLDASVKLSMSVCYGAATFTPAAESCPVLELRAPANATDISVPNDREALRFRYGDFMYEVRGKHMEVEHDDRSRLEKISEGAQS